jgi:hypothetical protein
VYKRWVGSLLVGLIFTGILVAPVWAGLIQGKFIPIGQARVLTVDSQTRYYQVQKETHSGIYPEVLMWMCKLWRQ